MRNFFPYKLKNNLFTFHSDDINHIVNVIKLQENEKIICNYENKKYLCFIKSLNPLNVEILEELNNINEFTNINITLFQAIIKPKHMEWIIAKTTELQLNDFYPIMLERSQSNNIIKYDRMQAIAKNAAKQSNRNNIPTIHSIINFDIFLNIINNYDLILVPYESEKEIVLGEVLEKQLPKTNICILIGPEGGFSQKEILNLKKINNVEFVCLSKTILRSETASFYTLSVLLDFLMRKINNEKNK